MTKRSDMEGVGGVRSLKSRWVVRGRLELLSVLYSGGGANYTSDMSLLRDEIDNCPLLTGNSLAGALKSYLSDMFAGYGKKNESNYVELLFGSRGEGDSVGNQSPLIVHDSLIMLPKELTTEIREGVVIDSSRGIAEEHYKFDIEVIPPGVEFQVVIALLVAEDDDEDLLLSLLQLALEGLEQSEISFGARQSRGYGKCTVKKWQARRYDLQSKEGWQDWLKSSPEAPCLQIEGNHIDQVFQNAWPQWKQGTNSLRKEDKRDRIVIKISLKNSSLLVREQHTTSEMPDYAHLRSGKNSVLPGTSLTGVMRARAMRIANLMREDMKDAQIWVESIFGTAREKDCDGLIASRLRVSEAVIKGGKSLRPSRVKIDRFTGGTVDGALFEEEPLYGGILDVSLELRNPCEGELGLLLLVIKDLLTGDLPVGGASSIGRGIFSGKAEITMPDQTSYLFDPEGSKKEHIEKLNNFVSQFIKAPVKSAKEVPA